MAFNYEYPYTDPNRHNSDWLINKVKEFEATLNSWVETIQELQAALTEINAFDARLTALEALKSTILQSASDIAKLKATDADIYQRLDKLKGSLDGITEGYTALIESVRVEMLSKLAVEATERRSGDSKLANRIALITLDYDRQLAEIQQRLEELVPVDVFNRVAGKRLDLNHNNYNIYEDLRYLGFTNAELSSFGQSNEHVASLVHDNSDYAIFAKKRFKRGYPFSPITGKRQNLTNELSNIIVLVGGGVSNSALASYMEANGLTNADLNTLLTDNFRRYYLLLN